MWAQHGVMMMRRESPEDVKGEVVESKREKG